MNKTIFLLAVITGINLLISCSDPKPVSLSGAEMIRQQADGTISLRLDKADCYVDLKNPSDNTAEWNVKVSKSGRYNVWISSATLDTTNLKYKTSVMVNVQDKMIQARPNCDRIIVNSSEVQYPYFKADSFIGSLYLQDTGQFYIQVTSEMILPKGHHLNESSAAEIAKLISVSFMPETR